MMLLVALSAHDGRSHPMKQAEESIREQRRDNKMAELQSIYFESLPDMLYERVKKNRPLIVRRREDFDVRVAKECNKLGIRVIQAPFEADWQLVEAQRAGLIDIILSENGDLFIELSNWRMLFVQTK